MIKQTHILASTGALLRHIFILWWIHLYLFEGIVWSLISILIWMHRYINVVE